MMLCRKSHILGLDFILELTNLILGNSELLTELDNLVIGNDEVLTVQVTIGTNNFIKVLLLLELALKLDVLLLKLTNEITLKLDLFNHLHQIGIGLVSCLGLFLFFSFNLSD